MGDISQPSAARAEELRYWCFISYSSKDKAVCQRLFKALETYRIPRDLVGRPGRDGPVPKVLFPCFRDRDELPLSSDLGSSIQDALRASRYLIVICTPASAHSRWVNEEVLFFKSIGRSDRILALIASGEPNASDLPGREKEECFCPALRYVVDAQGHLTNEQNEPIAGDLRRDGDGWTSAFLKCVAGITGLGFNAFAHREQKRRRRQQMLAGAMMLCALAAALWYWDYTRTKTAYYAFTESVWGVDQGVSPLSLDKVRHRNMSYKIESSRNKVLRVTEVNGSGFPTDDPNWYNGSTEEMRYGDNGDLQCIVYLNHNGGEVFREVYSERQPTDSGGQCKYVDFKLPKNTAAALDASFAAMGGDSADDASKSDISGAEGDFDADGQLVRVLFRNNSGTNRPNGDGIFGQRLEHNAQGFVSKDTNLGPDGQPMSDRRGIESLVHEYDASDNRVDDTYLGADGKPALNAKMYSSDRAKYDAYGNRIEDDYFRPDGEPFLKTGGYAKTTCTYDDRGNRVEWAYFGLSGEPVLSVDGYAKVTCQYDDHGNPVEQALCGVDGKPVIGKDGYAKFTLKYDDRGNAIESAFFGVDGKPTLDANGVARRVKEYDDRGDVVKQANYGVDGRPVADRNGIATLTRKYNERGSVEEEAYLGVDGNPVAAGDGVATFRMQYDDRGNEIEESCFGVDGKPVRNQNGYAKVEWKFNEQGNKTEAAYFGVDGQPVLSKDGVARVTNGYDAHGNLTESDYFGVDGKPALFKGAYAKITYDYDAHGYLTKEHHFDLQGKEFYLPMD